MENTTTPIQPLKWSHYIAVFFAALFLTNAVPHFVNGISGNPFPSPFSDPPGKGLSDPLTNVLWGFLNLVIGYLLYRVSKMTPKHTLAVILFFIGVLCMSIMLGVNFAEKAKM